MLFLLWRGKCDVRVQPSLYGAMQSLENQHDCQKLQTGGVQHLKYTDVYTYVCILNERPPWYVSIYVRM